MYPSIDAISGIQDVRNSYGPEYGQASGAIISITTKSGENQFHGGVFYAGRNDALDANDWFSNHNGTGKAVLRATTTATTSAVPSMKNKLFSGGTRNGIAECGRLACRLCAVSGRRGRQLRGRRGSFSRWRSKHCGATAPAIPFGFKPRGTRLEIANPDAAGLVVASSDP